MVVVTRKTKKRRPISRDQRNYGNSDSISNQDMMINRMQWMSRFYERLVLLRTIDPFNGNHMYPPSFSYKNPEDSCQQLRRKFLDCLAYVCDYDMGGDTVTAIALEDTPEELVYWLAANRYPGPKVLKFLTEILTDLRDLRDEGSSGNRTERERWIAKKCIEFGKKRVKGYQSLLSTQLNHCLEALSKKQGENDVELAIWLRSFQQKPSDYQVCSYCYDNRHDPWMNEIATRAGSSQPVLNGVSYAAAYGLVRHYIGRLSCHIRAAEIFIEAGLRLPNLFHNFRLAHLSSPSSGDVPRYLECEFTLDGILNRMTEKDDQRRVEYKEALSLMDQNFDILARLREQFAEESFKTRVHAELIVLDYFHSNELIFFAGDKYIACSKPACYCCYQYLRFHKGGFSLPTTHFKTYLNWRPPDIVDDGNYDRRWKEQRRIMSEVMNDISSQVLKKIRQSKGPGNYRPDSTTAITQSFRAMVIEEPSTNSVGNIGSSVDHHEVVDSPDPSDFEENGSSYVTADEDVGSGRMSPNISEYDHESDSEFEGGVP